MGVPFSAAAISPTAIGLTDAQLNGSTRSRRRACVIVNGAFASRYFPGQDPVGRTLVLYDDQTFGWSRTIVGVVADVRGQRSRKPRRRPSSFRTPSIPTCSCRRCWSGRRCRRRDRRGDPRSASTAYDPQLLVQRIRPMDDVVSGALSRPRFNLLLVGCFAARRAGPRRGRHLRRAGVSGDAAHARDRHPHGARRARGDVLRLVLREGMAPVAVGAARDGRGARRRRERSARCCSASRRWIPSASPRRPRSWRRSRCSPVTSRRAARRASIRSSRCGRSSRPRAVRT